MEFPTLYPTIVPKIPVPADWSILPKAIRTVMHTIATSTINALGGFVMFTLAPCPQQIVALERKGFAAIVAYL